jgi:hypothetical protein
VGLRNLVPACCRSHACSMLVGSEVHWLWLWRLAGCICLDCFIEGGSLSCCQAWVASKVACSCSHKVVDVCVDHIN